METKSQENFDEALRMINGVSSGVWLGGSDEIQEGTWLWQTDGSPISMTQFWEPGQPNGSPGDGQNFLSIGAVGYIWDTTGTWNLPYLCTFP